MVESINEWEPEMPATKKPKTVWHQTADGIMDRWLEASERSDRYSSVLRGDGQLNLGDRLERLLAVAFCREIWPLLKDERSRWAVEVAERYADGNATQAELDHARKQAWAAWNTAAHAYAADAAADAAHDADAGAAADAAADAAAVGAADAAAVGVAYAAADADRKAMWIKQGKMLVNVVGPGWEFDYLWRTSTAVSLAGHIYETRDFSAMPILADALQDAGCEASDLLASLRSDESVWCRGCKILDDLLMKRSGQ